MPYFKGWAILPAAQVLFGKTKVTIDEIAKEWSKGTVVVMEKPNGQLHFVAGCSGSYAKIGTMQQTYHDQTGAPFAGPWKVVDEVTYEMVDGAAVYSTASGNPVPTIKAALAVFK